MKHALPQGRRTEQALALTKAGAVKGHHRLAGGVRQRLHDVPPGEGAAPKAMHQQDGSVARRHCALQPGEATQSVSNVRLVGGALQAAVALKRTVAQESSPASTTNRATQPITPRTCGSATL